MRRRKKIRDAEIAFGSSYGVPQQSHIKLLSAKRVGWKLLWSSLKSGWILLQSPETFYKLPEIPAVAELSIASQALGESDDSWVAAGIWIEFLGSRGMTSWAWIGEESSLAFAGSAILRYWSSPPNI